MTVTVDTIAVALTRTAPASGSAEANSWEMWIADAVRAITREADKKSVSLDSLNSEDLDSVVREAVVAHIKHPDDATQVAIGVDDGNVSRTYRSSRGRVTILPEWWEILFPTTETRRAFEIDTMPNPTVLR